MNWKKENKVARFFTPNKITGKTSCCSLTASLFKCQIIIQRPVLDQQQHAVVRCHCYSLSSVICQAVFFRILLATLIVSFGFIFSRDSLQSREFLDTCFSSCSCSWCGGGGACSDLLRCISLGKDWFLNRWRCRSSRRTGHNSLLFGRRRSWFLGWFWHKLLHFWRHYLLCDGEDVFVEVVNASFDFFCRFFKTLQNLQSPKNDFHDLRWAALFPWCITAIKLSSHSPRVLSRWFCHCRSLLRGCWLRHPSGGVGARQGKGLSDFALKRSENPIIRIVSVKQ